MKIGKKIVQILCFMFAFTIICGTNSKATTIRVTVDDLNLREKASSDSDVYTTLSKGEEYTLVDEYDEWYQIEYEDYTGYISKDYAEIVEEEQPKDDNNPKEDDTNTDTNQDKNNDNTDNNIDTNTDNNTEQSATTTGKMNKNDKARILPLINATVLQTLKSGTKITIITEINGWSYITTEQISAWVRTDNITIDNTTTKPDNNTKPDNDKTDEPDNDTSTTPEDKNDFTEKTMYINDSYVNIRKEASTSSEVLMTVELNTEITVIGEEGEWYKVNTSVGEAYILKELLSDEKISTTSRGGKNIRGATENIAEEELQNTSTIDKISTSEGEKIGEKIVSYAEQFLGVPYVYGGASPSGFDCSGFTMYVFDKFGIDMAHGAQNQAELGKVINTDKSSSSSLKNNLQPGDLVFFLDYETMDEIGHCGIYIGDGEFIHASSGTGYCIKIDSLLPGEYYNTRYCAARRVI